jgi:hypothetical protein
MEDDKNYFDVVFPAEDDLIIKNKQDDYNFVCKDTTINVNDICRFCVPIPPDNLSFTTYYKCVSCGVFSNEMHVGLRRGLKHDEPCRVLCRVCEHAHYLKYGHDVWDLKGVYLQNYKK